MRREERELKRLAKKHGLVLERTTRHYRLRNAVRGIVAVTSSTASDHRTQRNLEAQIRRALRT